MALLKHGVELLILLIPLLLVLVSPLLIQEDPAVCLSDLDLLEGPAWHREGGAKEDGGIFLADDGDVLGEGHGALLHHGLLQDVGEGGVGEPDLVPQPVQLPPLAGTDKYWRPDSRDCHTHGVTQDQLEKQGL